MSLEMQLFAGGAGILLFVAGLYSVYSHYEVFKLVTGTPTTDVRAIDSEGLVELKGRVDSREPLPTTISGVPDAVLSGWRVDDWNERGDSSSWRTVALGVDSGRFELAAGTGSVTVDPPMATSGTVTSNDKLLSMGGEGVYVGDCRAEFDDFSVEHQSEPEQTPPTRIGNFVRRQPDVGSQSGSLFNVIDFGNKHGERRYYEATVTDGDEVYLLGHAQPKPDATYPLGPDDVVVGPDPSGDEPFVISTVNESRLVSRARRQMVVAAFGILLGVGLLGAALTSAGVLGTGTPAV